MTETICMEGPNKFKTVQYEPSCKFGHQDCINDWEYIKATYPDWYKYLTTHKGYSACCNTCEHSSEYDNEDK